MMIQGWLGDIGPWSTDLQRAAVSRDADRLDVFLYRK